ncbi:arginine--tRNA ligase [Formosimonas limnophila]|uniref:Arginine--tRNA ligase n=1 Tax=Formosimonas limnophila TaxID=1384487 RepID=A0A8J3CNA6_9BURK|nr:arginine--tRNA ligase [Formosimonas limnophila]GHA73607.1 arginine--tRNA ligase [Formosimonas limnophila]
MLATIKNSITQSFTAALQAVAPDVVHPITLERPRDTAHGDVACNMAMQLAKKVGTNPRALAESLIAHLPVNPDIAAVEIAGPGFMNIRLTDAAKQRVVTEVLRHPSTYGQSQAHKGERVMLEFVSANPTGPLHVGHARQAALGDTLGAVLASQGYDVHREFYYNDAGQQIANLAISVQARAKGLGVDAPSFPADGYRGDYIMDIAEAFVQKQSVNGVTATGNIESLDEIRDFAVAYLRREQDLDLQAFGVVFDNYFLESSLYTSGDVEKTVSRLTELGHTYEEGGALWFRSTDYGDDKDRVMRKAEGGYTYFVPDVAYHVNKWQRGFTKVINIQGTDHHGTIARVRAGVKACDVGVADGYPDYVLHKMVMVMKDGAEVKLSKRAGSYVTLRDLVEWTNKDAARFLLISRKADTEFVFDVDMAVSQSDENPVYYVQYAHARISSILDKAEVAVNSTIDLAALASLTASTETHLMKLMSEYPDALTAAATELAPHHVVYYLKDLAGAVHGFCGSKTERVLTDDVVVKTARVHLLAAAREVLASGLNLLGVSAPMRM